MMASVQSDLDISVRQHMPHYVFILLSDNEGPEQLTLMRRLIWACFVRRLHKDPFRAFRIIMIICWELIGSASASRFQWVPPNFFSGRNKKKRQPLSGAM